MKCDRRFMPWSWGKKAKVNLNEHRGAVSPETVSLTPPTDNQRLDEAPLPGNIRVRIEEALVQRAGLIMQQHMIVGKVEVGVVRPPLTMRLSSVQTPSVESVRFHVSQAMAKGQVVKEARPGELVGLIARSIDSNSQDSVIFKGRLNRGDHLVFP